MALTRKFWTAAAVVPAVVTGVTIALSTGSLVHAQNTAPARPAPGRPAGRGPQRPAATPPPAQGPKAPMADEVFKNVQVLKGISVAEFMDTMGFFAASIGSNCVHCHVDEALNHWERFADDVPRKRRARQMVLMVRAINQANFGGQQVVTCYSCHHGDLRPEGVPSLLAQYSLPVEDPNKVEPVPDAKGPSADQILDKFIAAVGGAQNLANVKSYTAKGTYEGFNTYEQKVPIDLYVKAPNQRALVTHAQNGESTAVFDGRQAWLASIDSPVTLMPLQKSDLDAARLDAALAVPAAIKQALTAWRVGFPMTSIDDRSVQIVQGTGQNGTRFKLYFDVESGLLVRTVRYAPTLVGTVPTQTDYSDYKAVGAIKIPYKTVITYTNGQGTIELTDVQLNAAVDAARFAEPPAAVVKPAVR
jgi:outer membrane lipoprotein-sorting protein